MRVCTGGRVQFSTCVGRFEHGGDVHLPRYPRYFGCIHALPASSGEYDYFRRFANMSLNLASLVATTKAQ